MNFKFLPYFVCILSYFHGISAQNYSRNQFSLIGKFSNKFFPGKSLTGVLCWKTEELSRLSLELSRETVFFKNYPDNILDDVILVDKNCNNPLKREKQKLLKNIIFFNVASCEYLPDWSWNFFLVTIYIFSETSQKFNVIKCTKPDERLSWKSLIVADWNSSEDSIVLRPIKKLPLNEISRPIEVAFVASEKASKNIQDFRRNLNIETTTRFNYHFFKEIFNYLNLTPAESFAPDVDYLEKFSITSKELIAHPLTVSKENYTLYDFVTTRTPHRQSFLLRAPSLSAVSNVFTLPLELNVWYASYIILVFILVTIFIIVKVEWRFPDMIKNKYRMLYPRMLDVVQMNVGAIAQQGSEAEPTSGGGKIATFLVYLFFLFLYTAYSANIVALLGSTTTRVHGVTDLKDFNVKLGVDKDDFRRESFRDQESKEHQALFKEKLAKDECYMSLDEGIDRIRSEFFAFHGNSDKIYKMINKFYVDSEKCGFVEIPYLAEPSLLVPIRKDSMYKEIIKIGLALFVERGMHDRIKNIMFSPQPQCYSGGTNFVSVSLLDCYFAFVIYSGGATMSFVIFLLEVLMHRSKLTHCLENCKSKSKHADILGDGVGNGDEDKEQLQNSLPSSAGSRIT